VICSDCEKLRRENSELNIRLKRVRIFAGRMAGAVIENALEELEQLRQMEAYDVSNSDPEYDELFRLIEEVAEAFAKTNQKRR
jgi:hypothetical protein